MTRPRTTATATLLSTRRLNRALLARQMLLRREKTTPIDALQRVVGMQAQLPRPPFVGLWTRLAKFGREDLLALARERKVVRVTAMRGTLHLLTVPDFLLLRPVLAAALASGADSIVGKHLVGTDRGALLQTGREYFRDRTASFDDFRNFLEETHDPAIIRAIAYVVRMGVPLVTVPGTGAWGWSPTGGFTHAEPFLGRTIPDGAATLDQVVLRYLAAFGPATPADAQVWSGIRGLREVFERLRGRLVTFRDEEGRELFDLPDAPRPSEDVDAPIRFLPEFDNVLLSHDDRSRIMSDKVRKAVISKNLQVAGTWLADGFVAGIWRAVEKKRSATLELRPLGPLARGARSALEEEGTSLIRFLAPEAAAHGVVVSR